MAVPGGGPGRRGRAAGRHWRVAKAQSTRCWERTHIRTLGHGAECVSMDQPGEAVYVVLAGSVRVEALEDVQRIIIAYLAVGDPIGQVGPTWDPTERAGAPARQQALWSES